MSGGFQQPGLVTGDKTNMHALPDKYLRDSGAYPTVCAGNHRNFTGQFHFHLAVSGSIMRQS